MIAGGRSWILLFGGALLVVLSGTAFVLPVSWERQRLLGVAVAVAGLAMLIGFAAFARVQRRVLEAARDLSSEDLATDPQASGADALDALSSTLNALRRRLASQMETIERQRRMLQALIDQSQEGVVVTHGDGRIALINPAAVRLLAIDVRRRGIRGLLDRHVADCIPQDALRRLLVGAPESSSTTGAQQAGGNGDPRASELRLEIETRSGKVHLLARVSKLVLAQTEGPAGAVTPGRVLLLTDITELERTIRMRSDFVANASHELRTPLSTIRASIETLMTMDLASEAPAARRFIQKIERQSERLQQMVADLLDLSRLESDTESFEPERLDTVPVLDELHARFAEALERKGLHWEVTYDPPGANTIVVNSHLLRLVLDNLVDNAIKFTEPGGHIRVGLRRSKGLAVLEIVDDGCGIPEDEQQRVFERFYQVQQSRSGPERGTGLGLSIVRHAVEAMDGRVRLQSNPGGGTRAIVIVPQAGTSGQWVPHEKRNSR